MTSSRTDTYYGEAVSGYEFNIGQIFSILFSVGFFSLICPTWIVARFCIKKKELIQEEDVIPYEKRYQFDPNECSGGNIENLERNILLEQTPQGRVCMKYSDEEEAFEYWSDTPLNFNILETVARKYVKTFLCSDIFIDREKELEKKIEGIKEEIEANKKKMEESEEEEEEEEEEDSVFLTSKKSRDDKKLKLKLTADDRTIEKCNKYIRKGKFCEATWFVVEKPKDKKKEMSFTEWLLSSKKNKNV